MNKSRYYQIKYSENNVWFLMLTLKKLTFHKLKISRSLLILFYGKSILIHAKWKKLLLQKGKISKKYFSTLILILLSLLEKLESWSLDYFWLIWWIKVLKIQNVILFTVFDFVKNINLLFKFTFSYNIQKRKKNYLIFL